jgi:hypothetical protein
VDLKNACVWIARRCGRKNVAANEGGCDGLELRGVTNVVMSPDCGIGDRLLRAGEAHAVESHERDTGEEEEDVEEELERHDT